MFTKSTWLIGKALPKFEQVGLSRLQNIRARNFGTKVGFEDSKIWEKMSESDRVNCALAESEPQTAKMAFYRGKGLLSHRDYNGAIAAFERAVELDKAYTAPSDEAIALIYAKIGKKDEAFQFMYKAYKALGNAKTDPKQLKILDLEIGKKYTPFSGLA